MGFKAVRPKVYVFVLIVFSLLVLGEIVLRVKHSYFGSDSINNNPSFSKDEEKLIHEYEKMLYEYKPYILWRGVPNQTSAVFKINSLGLRGDEYSKVKANGVYRIIVLGGSSAWGWGAGSNSTTIAANLERELNLRQKTKKVEVYSFAENGYNSSQELVLWREISEYSPDLVIHYTGYNDIYTGLLKLKPGWNHSFIQEGVIPENIFSMLSRALKLRMEVLIQKLSSNIKLYASIKYRVESILNIKKNSSINFSYSDSNEIADIFSKNFLFSARVAKDLKVPVLIILQPSLFTDNKLLSNREEKILLQFEKNYYPGSLAYYRQTYDLIKQKLNENKLGFAEGNNFFEGINTDIYFDTAHYFDKGNEIVAQKIVDTILNRNFIK